METLQEILDSHAKWLKSEGSEGQRADLSGANLSDADLSSANLSDADLSDADLPVSVSNPDPDLIKKVAKRALQPDALEMSTWHSCETTHCIAGWAVKLHPEGLELEAKTSTYLAARLLLGGEAVRHFFDSNEEATKWLKTFL